MKKAYTLFELTLVLFISSIIFVSSFKLLKELNQNQIEKEKLASLKIDMYSTKIIIERNLPKIKDKLYYDGSTLFFGENILLKNVSSFAKKDSSDIFTINITLENKISQIWKFKNQ